MSILSIKQLHDEVTRLVNAISQGGGGGGSTVSVVSKRTTGENIADITVNNTTTQLYAPDSASDISFDPTVKGVYSGTNTQSVVDEITDDITSLNDTISNTPIIPSTWTQYVQGNTFTVEKNGFLMISITKLWNTSGEGEVLLHSTDIGTVYGTYMKANSDGNHAVGARVPVFKGEVIEVNKCVNIYQLNVKFIPIGN